jgi:integrase
MLKRRLKQAGLPAHYSPHSFRATGITNFLENDGTLEAAQRIAGTPTAGLRNSMTAAVRRFSWRTWNEMPSSTFEADSVLMANYK